MTRIRNLDPVADREVVADLFARAADHVWLERGEAPDAALANKFFTDAPPGADPAQSLRLGLVQAPDGLAGIAEVGFGYPEPGDAYLGRMLLAPDQRGQGQGRAFLAHVEAAARAAGARRLFIAVLHANPRARAFWEDKGFAVALDNRPTTLGRKTHLATRMVKPL